MPQSILSLNQCFQPGDDLWIIPDYENSKLTQKIDWYLNFQISKSKMHHRPIISNFLEKTLEQCELPKFNFTEKNILMIAPQNLLPSQWVVVVSFQNLLQWKSEIDRVWNDLGTPKTRVFLPKQIMVNDIDQTWTKVQPEFTFVIDPLG